MTPATLLLCTTIITNINHGSVVTRECQPQPAQIEVITEAPAEAAPAPAALPKPVAPFPSASLKNAASPLTLAAGDTAEPKEQITVRQAKPKRARVANHTPRRQFTRRAPQVEVVPTAYASAQPAKRLSFWERLNQLPKIPFKALVGE